MPFKVNGRYVLNTYQSASIHQFNPLIERAVIVIHGVARNADEYFDYTHQAAIQSDALKDSLILAPHYKLESDSKSNNELFWGSSWKFGDLSLESKISSFEVLDQLIEEIWLGGNFPNLKKVVVIGHSAGGQFVARYAAGTPLINRTPFQISFVIANPSSYFYFSPERWHENKGFIIPDNQCPEYDVYPYGTTQLNSYMEKVSIRELQERFIHRSVFLLLGEEDHLSQYLDTSCEANLQGKDRFERGMNYYKFIKTFYPKSSTKLRTVPGVGHSGEKMIQSSVAREILFH